MILETLSFAKFQAERFLLQLLQQQKLSGLKALPEAEMPAWLLPPALAAKIARLHDDGLESREILIELRNDLKLHRENDGSQEQRCFYWLKAELSKRHACETRYTDQDGGFVEGFQTLYEWLDELDDRQEKSDIKLQKYLQTDEGDGKTANELAKIAVMAYLARLRREHPRKSGTQLYKICRERSGSDDSPFIKATNARDDLISKVDLGSKSLKTIQNYMTEIRKATSRN
jgi:hypothetical protein